MRSLRVLGLGLSLLLGCYDPPPFVCTSSSDCDSGGGACIEGGCAYPAFNCPTGMRYSEHAARANECAPTRQADAGR